MELYAVAFDSPTRIAFYWADDVEHAKDQANDDTDMDIDSVYAVRAVPGEYGVISSGMEWPTGRVVIYTTRYTEDVDA